MLTNANNFQSEKSRLFSAFFSIFGGGVSICLEAVNEALWGFLEGQGTSLYQL